MNRDPNCTGCKLHQTANTVCLLGRGPKTSDVMIVGEAPGKSEDESGKPFIGRAGQKLTEMLAETSLIDYELFVTNAVSCRPPDNRTPSKGEVKACKKWLDYQMSIVKPRFVLLLGNIPLISITGKAGIKAQRGRPFKEGGIIYLPTYHPASTFYNPDNEVLIRQDLELFAEIVEHGEVPREDSLSQRIVRDRETFLEMREDLVRGPVSFDLETTCLYPWDKDAAITSIGFGTARHQWMIPATHRDSPWSDEEIEEMVAEIDDILDEMVICAHGGKFDFLWMKVIYGVDWQRSFDFDTMLAHYILDENSLHGLKFLAQLFCGAPNWDIDKDDKRGEASYEYLARYHAHDLYYTRELRYVLGRKLLEDGQVKDVFDKILMPCARLFVEVEYDGVYVDESKFDEAEIYLRSQMAEAEASLSKWGNINWGSPKQLGDLLFNKLKLPIVERTKTGAASTSESVLNRIDHPCVGDLIKFRGAKQQLSFFIEGWKPYIHKSRLHPSFKLHGTVTGRLSCEHPNLQQVPRDPRIRSLIIAPPGWTLVEADLSQIELRIAAELANEQVMLEAFRSGKDVHWITAIREIARGGAQAEIVLDTVRTYYQDKSIDYAEAIEKLLEMGEGAASELRAEWKELRKKAKAINFGYLYGMWWKKFKIYARDNYGVEVTDQEAQDSRAFFFGTYNFQPWHERQKRYARRNGYVRSLSGRKRRLPKAMSPQDTPERRESERQAINSPVQSFANELNLMAAIQIRKEFSRRHVRLVGTVHDAVLLWVRTTEVERVVRRVLVIMSHPDLLDEMDIRISVPIEAEAKIGPWSQGVSLEKWLKHSA